MAERVKGFEPYFNSNSIVLILGSFPSVKSREVSFYYGNERNRFWEVLAKGLNEEKPTTLEEKKALLDKHNVALWDIVTECEIKGSQDASIKLIGVANIRRVLEESSIKTIITNGNKAKDIFLKFYPDLENMVISLPSTSPANARLDVNVWINTIKELKL